MPQQSLTEKSQDSEVIAEVVMSSTVSVRVQRAVFNNQPQVHIRFYLKGYPTRNGLVMTPKEWEKFVISLKGLSIL